MKQILRFRGCYCPRQIQPICLFLLTANLLLGGGWHHAFGQPNITAIDKIGPLRTGDTIPDALWDLALPVVNHPGDRETITLNDYRDRKLIVLDFWATWCSPCVASLEKLGVLLGEFEYGDLGIVPINSFPAINNPFSSTSRFLTKREIDLPSVIDIYQVLYEKVFPPAPGSGIPHIVWIRDNRIIATSDAADVTRQTLREAIEGSNFNQP